MTIVEQLKAVQAEREALRLQCESAASTVAGLTDQLTAIGLELEACKAAQAELVTVKEQLAKADEASRLSTERADALAAEVADLKAKLSHAPGAYSDATNGTKPVDTTTAPADTRRIFTRAEISRMSRAEYAKNRKAILEQMANGEIK